MTLGAFLEAIRDRTGDTIRLVVRRDGARAEVLYARADVDRRDVENRLRAIHEELDGAWLPLEMGRLPTLGGVNATVQFCDDGVIVNVPTTEDQGLVVTLDVEAAPDLPGLLEEYTRDAPAGELTVRGGTEGKEGEKRCPHCGSMNYAVKSDRPGRPRKRAPRFQCRYCGEGFDEPVYAESRLSVLEDESGNA